MGESEPRMMSQQQVKREQGPRIMNMADIDHPVNPQISIVSTMYRSRPFQERARPVHRRDDADLRIDGVVDIRHIHYSWPLLPLYLLLRHHTRFAFPHTAPGNEKPAVRPASCILDAEGVIHEKRRLAMPGVKAPASVQ